MLVETYRRLVAVLTLTVLVLGTLMGPSLAGTGGEVEVSGELAALAAEYDPHHVLVQFEEGTLDQDRARIHAELGTTVVNRLHSIRLDVVRLPKGLTPLRAVALYDDSPAVTYVNVNDYMIHPAITGITGPNRARSESESSPPGVPNDPRFTDQWALHNDGSVYQYSDVEGTGVNLEPLLGEVEEEFDMDVLDGWARLNSAQRDPVRVAILDTGLNLIANDEGRMEPVHRDLRDANVVACAQATSQDGSVEEGLCDDDHEAGHGTAAVGIIAASPNNGVDVAGIAPEVELVIAKFLSSPSRAQQLQSTMADYVAMIEWATQQDIDIMNINWWRPFAESPRCEEDPLERLALQNAHDAGVLIVAFAGLWPAEPGECRLPHGPSAPRYPAAYPFVLSAASTDPLGRVWQDDDSFFGTECIEADIMAPGAYIFTTDHGQMSPDDPPPDSWWQGPAVTAPHVTAVAAVLMEQENLTNEEVRDRLLATESTTEVEPHPLRPDACEGLRQVNLALALAAGPLQVTIDIKPGSDDNPINTAGSGTIPVALITTDDFEARDVDPVSVVFGPGAASSTRESYEDVDGDGDLDLLFHFDQRQTGIGPGDTQSCLDGLTVAGSEIHGCDVVTVK